jgi:FtsP/CotA-like multicopper oxidase with cupredoxin domain
MRPRRFTFTRRQMLKWGVAAGGSLLLPLNYGGRKGLRVPGVLADDDDPRDFQSPRISAPFTQRLPIPPVAQPVDRLDDVSSFTCRRDDKTNPLLFTLVEEEVAVPIFPGLPPTKVWRYRDVNDTRGSSALGPTFKLRMGAQRRTVIVRIKNRLPTNHVGFGVPCSTVHHHGGHIDSLADGFPENQFDGPDPLPLPVVFVPPDFRGFEPPPELEIESPHGCQKCDAGVSPTHFDYCWGMQDPGWRHGDPHRFDRPSTNWYHDHLFDLTGPNVYRGLAGLIEVFDEKDSDNEQDTTPGALRLPSGAFDIPLVLTDKLFDQNAQLLYLPGNHDGFLGDTVLVNGVIQPYLRVYRRKYRFRSLDATNARFFRLFLADERGQTFPLMQIAHGGGLHAFPFETENIEQHMAERVEFVIDFKKFPGNTVLYLEDRLVQEDGRGPKGTFEKPEIVDRGRRLLKFIVEPGDVYDPSRVPSELRPFPKITASEQANARRRTFVFDRGHGVWTINNQPAELDFFHSVAQPRLNEGEVWRFINKSGGWWHPIHVHLEFMRVLRRNGALPPLEERDGVVRDDTVVLGPNSDIEVFFKFRDYPGPWVFHCHNIEHEDMRMMARFDVVA